MFWSSDVSSALWQNYEKMILERGGRVFVTDFKRNSNGISH